MTEISFTLNQRSQSASVNPNEIHGHFDNLQAYLNVYLRFTFRTPGPEVRYDVLPLSAKLMFQHPMQFLSEAIQSQGVSILSQEQPVSYTFSFPLSEKAIHFIEKNRNGDIPFNIEVQINALNKRLIPNHPGSQYFATDYFLTDICKLPFQIPKSNWIEKILPKLGYRNLKLIEIPVTHERLKEAYDNIISEFNLAELYFNSQDYNKCVAHCRSTLDALNRNLISIKKESKSGSGFKWLETVGTETFKWIDELERATYQLASKSHHTGTGTRAEFTRQEAESIYTVILGLLNYVGHLKA